MGGLGGYRFMSHRYASVIRRMRAWQEDGALYGLEITYTNGDQDRMGGRWQPTYFDRAADANITLKDGEYIDDCIWVNQGQDKEGTVVTHHVWFKTNTGQVFDVAYPSSPALCFNANGRILTGVFGFSGWAIDSIGFLVMYEIKSAH